MQKEQPSPVKADRQLLQEAQQKGSAATLLAYARLSGPGWLQSAITLGGGSLAGALFLGSLGGVNMLWLQLMAILMGVIMLSAISYVTLSTGERPFQAINTHVNPVLGWGWLAATSMANMIWCMPQFSLCYDALHNLTPGTLGTSNASKLGVSAVIFVLVSCVVALNARRGLTAELFDWLLKGLVGMVVICFFGVVSLLAYNGDLNWAAIFAGFIPDFSQWNSPSGEVATLVGGLPEETRSFWDAKVVTQQRATIIAAFATAVGINMTFLMPYAMLHRGWDKPFRGLARFDLATGMLVPYVLVTTCVVIAAAYAFHGKADEQFLSTDPAAFQESPTFRGAKDMLLARLDGEQFAGQKFDQAVKGMSESEKQLLVAEMAALPEAEKRIAASMVQRNADQLSQTLAPLIGKERANFIFGLGVFGMGFSTIIILMLINGFVFCEATGRPDAVAPYVAGCVVAGIVGMLWPLIWTGDSRFWLAIVASNFGMMLLPIAYVTFFMMMNSRTLMGKEKPTGLSMIAWNALMGVALVVATVAASGAIWEKVNDTSTPLAAVAGKVVAAMVVIFVLLIIAGFILKPKRTDIAGEGKI